ncbi:MAG: hypothetical protein CL773_01970 [Chloroflexi bacterium]|nr:hypothetical protein [Chloroflexota bacterium]|tara:strand:+ start:3164 stop:3529 length:366 start_codon:yes stop_codon:yes gene_type:complete
MAKNKIVFYDHNCKICTCFAVWMSKRTNYWRFYPNDLQTVESLGFVIDQNTLATKIVVYDKKLFFGGIAILNIFAKSGGILGFLSKFFLLLKFLYPIYFLGYYLFSKNRSKFGFLIKYLNC